MLSNANFEDSFTHDRRTAMPFSNEVQHKYYSQSISEWPEVKVLDFQIYLIKGGLFGN